MDSVPSFFMEEGRVDFLSFPLFPLNGRSRDLHALSLYSFVPGSPFFTIRTSLCSHPKGCCDSTDGISKFFR